MIYTIYNPTGQILGTMTFSSSEIAELNLKDKLHILGEYGEEYYISNGQPYLKPAKPEEHYEFDYSTKQWVLNIADAVSSVLTRRTQCLSAIDRINPLWWNSMTQSQQDEVAQYRQALLDITSQPGYPTTVEWPQKPAWL
jgi:hypothetical protein